ncbi:hypothetical protein PLESTB_000741800 [Pleodorina starrii]|uniref:LysM domain-containing protein n=1 Tax=Pleodorina starrii TaxID=330485 RepID=A0A9W6BK94_9CHLO|nr:hypothetical protein PLESTB_000741800 [Pleodorina starrii]GLC69733.1 hypothetical protein PLESTF_000874000 [Pleodorina starrii]
MESSGNSSSVAFNLTNPEEAASTSPRTSQVGEEQTSSLFVKHQVSKLDTLAGLAIKYNVSVGDIKRANGLLSDNALYARGVVLIPTRHLPIGDEIQRICAQVLSGVSRDPVLHADSQSQPASAAVARIATTLNVINGQSYPEDIPITESAWLAMCQCGTCGPMDPNGLCPRNLQPVEVELTDRSSEGMYLPPASAGPTRAHEAVRRRRNQADDADSCTDSANSWGGWGSVQQRQGGGARAGQGRADSTSENGLLASWFSELGKAIGEGVSNTVAKVKEAANQPVLAMPSGPSGGLAAAAADAIISSRRRASSAVLGRAPFEGGAIGGGGGGGSSSHAGGSFKAKQGGKLD